MKQVKDNNEVSINEDVKSDEASNWSKEFAPETLLDNEKVAKEWADEHVQNSSFGTWNMFHLHYLLISTIYR